MTYKITERLLKVVGELFEQGYKGTVELTNCYATGTEAVLGSATSIKLSGFCKESLYLVEDDEGILVVGRYSEEGRWEDISVEHIVQTAWQFYKSYKTRGYSMPYEFVDLFKKYGYLKEETKTVLVEAD